MNKTNLSLLADHDTPLFRKSHSYSRSPGKKRGAGGELYGKSWLPGVFGKKPLRGTWRNPEGRGEKHPIA